MSTKKINSDFSNVTISDTIFGSQFELDKFPVNDEFNIGGYVKSDILELKPVKIVMDKLALKAFNAVLKKALDGTLYDTNDSSGGSSDSDSDNGTGQGSIKTKTKVK
ncbi:MAG: hypothetical protein MK066_14560 [Crocinitomicaceae bacterium]|nr:hypothetical protein [Crocinitomicaceae bacterium]